DAARRDDLGVVRALDRDVGPDVVDVEGRGEPAGAVDGELQPADDPCVVEPDVDGQAVEAHGREPALDGARGRGAATGEVELGPQVPGRRAAHLLVTDVVDPDHRVAQQVERPERVEHERQGVVVGGVGHGDDVGEPG